MSQKYALLESLENLLPLAFGEDMPDITGRAVARPGQKVVGRIEAKEQGVVCGVPFLPYIFNYRMANLSVVPQLKDGELVRPGEVVAIVEGSAIGMLAAERVALNFLQRLSGIATGVRRFTASLQNPGVTILDTRKTTPGWRMLEKYAVRVGGARNHRMGAYDAYLVKENHGRIAGGLARAVESVLNGRADSSVPVIVEVTGIEGLKTILTMGVDRIMLDNFDVETIREAVTVTAGKVPLEISGGVNLDNIQQYAGLGIQFISIGALTHSAKTLDLSMEIYPVDPKQSGPASR